MDGLRGHQVDEARLAMYRRTAVEALGEIDELQTEILAAHTRVAAMMARVRVLESLVSAAHELVGPSVELPVNLRPVRIEGLSDDAAEPLPLRRRDRVRLPASDAETPDPDASDPALAVGAFAAWRAAPVRNA